MSFLDAASLFEGLRPEFVALTTFNFDGVFFEKRLLWTGALDSAKRVLLLIDRSQWQKFAAQDPAVTRLNARYLVVPVDPPKGVFHPKVHLMLGRGVARLGCGSANLTRAGITHNLELLNTVTVLPDKPVPGAPRALFKDALAFMQRVCRDAEGQAAKLASDWLKEAELEYAESLAGDNREDLEFVHSYDGSLWERLWAEWDRSPPRQLTIVSPFFDTDCRLLSRVAHLLPECEIRLAVQNHTSTLDAIRAAKLVPRLKLHALECGGRTLHAKLIAWHSKDGSGFLAGSANFTTAAVDGRNVEACLLGKQAGNILEELFTEDIKLRPIRPADFIGGARPLPEDERADPPQVRVISAALDDDRCITVEYECRDDAVDSLAVALRGPSDRDPAMTRSVGVRARGSTVVTLPEVSPLLSHASIRVSLIYERDEQRVESDPCWALKPASLTRQPANHEPSNTDTRLVETGQGIIERLDGLANAGGAKAMIEYLRNLMIRFHEGGGGGTRMVSWKIRDPYRTDDREHWQALIGGFNATHEAAFEDFADRHERERLRRHAKRGNVNGLFNFVDILTAVSRTLYVYHRRGLVRANKVTGRLCRYAEIAVSGINEREDVCPSYLSTLVSNLRGDRPLLAARLKESGMLATARAALFLAQTVRVSLGDSEGPKNTHQALKDYVRRFAEAIKAERVEPPSVDAVLEALDRMATPSSNERAAWETELSTSISMHRTL